MIDTQMLKGVIEAIVLETIRRNETYGYKIVEELKIKGFYTLTEGTIYPILKRLSSKGYILGVLKKSNIGPIRKYYYITPKGREYLQKFLINRDDLKNGVNSVFNLEDK
ncbi:MAG: PadR family transcriptional regulator [Peptoniphilaceae bacterium]|nr:PadR family transcriptional regulator [Peptoniphilaceae bacterium]MDD7383042.1 PadR family transcriptional regulator [Peptoniphilaceae bacterium]MDY3737550.1 PadR family transcriptional regulator [Peptoniphilaceae bacterium]